MIKAKTLLCQFQKRNHLHLRQTKCIRFSLFLHATENIASETIKALTRRILGNSNQQEKSEDKAHKIG